MLLCCIPFWVLFSVIENAAETKNLAGSSLVKSWLFYQNCTWEFRFVFF